MTTSKSLLSCSWLSRGILIISRILSLPKTQVRILQGAWFVFGSFIPTHRVEEMGVGAGYDDENEINTVV